MTIGQSSPKVTDFAKEEAKKVAEEFAGRGQELRGEQDKALAALVKVQGDGAARRRGRGHSATEDWMDHYGRAAAPVAGLLLFVLLLAALFVTLPALRDPHAGFAVGVALCGLVLLVVSLAPLMRGIEREHREAAPVQADQAKAHQQLGEAAVAERNGRR